MAVTKQVVEYDDNGNQILYDIGALASNIVCDTNHRFVTDAQISNWDSKADGNHSHTTINGHTVESDVPANAMFTDTEYIHPDTPGNKHIPSGGSSGQILRWSADGEAEWGVDQDTTYGKATSTQDGLMAKEDKEKLDGLENSVHLTRAEYDAMVEAGTIDDDTMYVVTDDYDNINIINDTNSSDTTTYSSNKVNNLLGDKSGKSIKSTITMAASSWSGTAAPYTITLSVPGATATNNIEIVPPGDLTITQAEAYMGASILNGTQEEGSITLKAYGDKPTIDIPIEIIVRGD